MPSLSLVIRLAAASRGSRCAKCSGGVTTFDRLRRPNSKMVLKNSETVVRLLRSSSCLGEVHSIIGPKENDTLACIMGCLIYSLEKLSERKRRILFYIAFFIGGLLTLAGFAGFLTPQKGWAFIVVVSGIFILITTGILWDTMAHPGLSNPETCMDNSANIPSAPDRVEDEPPPDYDSVVRNKDLPRTSSKWSLYNQTWCPSFNPKMGYDKTATTECNDVVTDAPPSYNQSQALPQGQPAVNDVSRCLGVLPTAVHVRRETKIEINQK